jgi:beta-lactamase class A
LWIGKHRILARRALIVLAIFVGVVTLFQLVYPAGRILPFVSIAGSPMGGQTTTKATQMLTSAYKDAHVSVVTDDKTFTQPLDQVGVDVEAGATARAAAKYSIGQRLIPFSSLFIMAFRNTQVQVQLDQDRVQYFAQQVSRDGLVPAVNASVAVKDGRVSLVSAKPSKSYPAKDVSEAFSRIYFVPKTTIRLNPVVEPAERTDKEVQQVLGQAQQAVDKSLILNVEGEKITVDKATVGTWLDFPEDEKTKRLTLSLKADEVKKYLQTIQSKVYKAPGKTTVQVVDGQEVGRVTGQPGQGIDIDNMIGLLGEAIHKDGDSVIAVPIAKLAPTVVYNRQYSNSSNGLAALLADLANTKGGYGIAVSEMNGRNSSANGNKKFIAASTYKLYVAYAVFKKIEAGEMRWSDEIYGGKNAEVCFDLMIVRSDNPCAKAFATRITWRTVQDMARSIGVSGNTTLTTPDLYTTANDLTLLLTKLQNGTLVSPADQARWIDAMKRQIYRQGIPAGTGVTVADKVGFLDGYLHDAGIVYGPKGPYVMVIMSQGSSWAQMADAARQIHAFLQR